MFGQPALDAADGFVEARVFRLHTVEHVDCSISIIERGRAIELIELGVLNLAVADHNLRVLLDLGAIVASEILDGFDQLRRGSCSSKQVQHDAGRLVAADVMKSSDRSASFARQ